MPTNTSVLIIGQGLLNIYDYVSAKIWSLFNNHYFSSSFLVRRSISNEIPSINLDTNLLNIPKDIILAESTFAKSGRVDLLLTSGLFCYLLDGKQHKLGSGAYECTKKK